MPNAILMDLLPWGKHHALAVHTPDWVDLWDASRGKHSQHQKDRSRDDTAVCHIDCPLTVASYHHWPNTICFGHHVCPILVPSHSVAPLDKPQPNAVARNLKHHITWWTYPTKRAK